MKSKPSAVILAGAVAKGAFQAGALEVLMEAEVPVSCVVATSSGALNGSLLACGIRLGCAQEATRLLVQAWQEKATWSGILRPSFSGLILGRGVNTQDRLIDLLSQNFKTLKERSEDSARSSTPENVDLKIVVTALNGISKQVGPSTATTYEQVLLFTNEDFESRKKFDDVIRAAVAASSFPGVFVPYKLSAIGPCWDGGITNNTPIKYALEDEDIARIFVIVPFPAQLPKPDLSTGDDLLSHLADLLINERLYRDLKDGESVNNKITGLEKLVAQGALTASQLDKVKKILGWRKAEIISIRPPKKLSGGSFTGFFKYQLRQEHIAAGREAARKALGLPTEA
jgi:NTE family protein